ncbi:nitroreductase family protein [Candidatus Woesearchaeota archaeon]|nr:nitroreductase family protein [Candidatus Woesearchaeota archaeon]
MDTLECLEKRRSVRKFTDSPVEWEKVGNLLRAAQLAPSSGNTQDWKFVVIADKLKRAALANAALKQHWIAQAPIIIVVYSMPQATARYYGLRGEKLYTIQNSAAATENILLAATAQGLASCWVGAFDEKMVNQVLGAPDDARPQAIIPVGYSDDEPKLPTRHRLYDITFLNSWGNKVVNVDLFFDEFASAVQTKIAEAKETLKEKGPALQSKITEKGKEGVKKIHEKIKDSLAARKKRKEKELAKELGDEEEVLEETDDNI